MSIIKNDTIVAIATAPSNSAISIVRLSGDEAIEIVSKVFKGKNLKVCLNNITLFLSVSSDTFLIKSLSSHMDGSLAVLQDYSEDWKRYLVQTCNDLEELNKLLEECELEITRVEDKFEEEIKKLEIKMQEVESKKKIELYNINAIKNIAQKKLGSK